MAPFDNTVQVFHVEIKWYISHPAIHECSHHKMRKSKFSLELWREKLVHASAVLLPHQNKSVYDMP